MNYFEEAIERIAANISHEVDGAVITELSREAEVERALEDLIGDRIEVPPLSASFWELPKPETICYHIMFEHSIGSLLFREKRFVMCAAGVFEYNTFDRFPRENDRELQPWITSRPRNHTKNYEFDGYRISFKKSDYERSKLYISNKSKKLCTLYVTHTNNLQNDEKAVFIIEENYLFPLKHCIYMFNYDLCQKVCQKENCKNRLVNPQLIEENLPNELFSV